MIFSRLVKKISWFLHNLYIAFSWLLHVFSWMFMTCSQCQWFVQELTWLVLLNFCSYNILWQTLGFPPMFWGCLIYQEKEDKLGLSCAKLRASLIFSGLDWILVWVWDKFWVGQKLWVQNKFWVRKNLSHKNIKVGCLEKKFWVRNKFRVWNNFGSKTDFWFKTNFGSEKLLGLVRLGYLG